MALATEPLKATLDLKEKIHKLNTIGIALSSEHNLRDLLEMIVREARNFTHADGASLYIKEKGRLKFVISQTSSLDGENGDGQCFSSFFLPLTKQSIAGYVAVTGELLNIKDVYKIPATVEYRVNKDFDVRTGYRSRSMLVVPMRDHADEIIGVLQLINSLDTDGEIIPFEPEYETIILSLASQAAVAIRNVRLIEDIRRLFRSLVRYSAKAIDARSPQTAGHSGRVAKFSVRIAQAINEETEGRLGAIHFTDEEIEELRMAAWLHDIGKIGVSESVLEKSNKLTDARLNIVIERFETIKIAIRNNYLQRKVAMLNGRKSPEEVAELKSAMEHELNVVDGDLEFIKHINIPGRLTAEDRERLETIVKKRFRNGEGKERRFLTKREFDDLSIVKGNLTEEEYREMQSHVKHTIGILNKIPFTKDLERIPQIAAAHHEYLDGSGYPKGLRQNEICIQSRIMCIADIFDALRSPDRPYKKPLSLTKTLAVLEREAAQGKLDRDIVGLFVRKKLYQRTPQEDDEE